VRQGKERDESKQRTPLMMVPQTIIKKLLRFLTFLLNDELERQEGKTTFPSRFLCNLSRENDDNMHGFLKIMLNNNPLTHTDILSRDFLVKTPKKT
jgi:hypothetical protein